MADHGDLLEAAAVDYLSALTTWGDDLGTRIYAGANNLDKDGARIVCYCGELTEDPPFSRNRWADLTLELRTPVGEDPEAAATQLALHTVNASALQAAVEDDGLVLGLTNASLHVYAVTERNGETQQDESGWLAMWKLRVYSIPI